MARLYPYLREISSPVTADQLQPLAPECRTVQFCEPLTDNDHVKVAYLLRGYPAVALRVYGHRSQGHDLDFLRHYPDVRKISVDLYNLTDVSALEQFASPELESLAFGRTKSKTHSLAFLRRFRHLKSLYIEGHTKDIDTIGTLNRLEDLTLRSITLPDLSSLKPLKGLLSLDIKLGGTKNLGLLPEIGRLRYLELWLIRGLADVGPIGDIRTLQYLFLQALKNIKEIPPLARLRNLRRVYLETMKGLADLGPVAEAPALEDIVVVDMPHLQPLDFRAFVGHPTLRNARIGLGSFRKNRAVADLLGVPDVIPKFRFRDATD